MIATVLGIIATVVMGMITLVALVVSFAVSLVIQLWNLGVQIALTIQPYFETAYNWIISLA